MTQSFPTLYPLLVMIVLATLAIGLPLVVVLAIRFLLDRSLNLGRSKELEKLIWQLHRIASAMEHQMNLSFPPVQPGTEEPRDLAYLKQVTTQAAASPTATTGKVAAAAASASQPAVQQAGTSAPAEDSDTLPPLQRREPTVEVPRAGVNSMFDL